MAPVALDRGAVVVGVLSSDQWQFWFSGSHLQGPGLVRIVFVFFGSSRPEGMGAGTPRGKSPMEKSVETARAEQAVLQLCRDITVRLSRPQEKMPVSPS